MSNVLTVIIASTGATNAQIAPLSVAIQQLNLWEVKIMYIYIYIYIYISCLA